MNLFKSPIDFERALAGEPLLLANNNKGYIIHECKLPKPDEIGERIFIGYEIDEDGNEIPRAWTNTGFEIIHGVSLAAMWEVVEKNTYKPTYVSIGKTKCEQPMSHAYPNQEVWILDISDGEIRKAKYDPEFHDEYMEDGEVFFSEEAASKWFKAVNKIAKKTSIDFAFTGKDRPKLTKKDKK